MYSVYHEYYKLELGILIITWKDISMAAIEIISPLFVKIFPTTLTSKLAYIHIYIYVYMCV
jgi:hypothetical protein